MKFVITLRDTTQQVGPLTVKFDIKKTALAKKWTEMLIDNILSSDHPIEKTYCLHGWQTEWESNYSRNLNVLCDKLNESISIVNTGMNPLGYPFIDLHFSLDKLKSKDYQIMMNEIHHHFEVLIGQVWSMSEWYKIAPDQETRTAIRMLNNYCHEIEGTIKSIKSKIEYRTLAYKDIHPSLRIHVSTCGLNPNNKLYKNKKSHYIIKEEFECFQDYTVWGDIILYYAQLGKNHMEVFHDQDEHIGRDNISSYQIITGESVISFDCERKILGDDFKTWCKENNFDLNDKTLGIGMPVVASIENTFSTKIQLEQELRARDDVYKISVEDDQGNEISSKIYDYTWQDEERWKTI